MLKKNVKLILLITFFISQILKAETVEVQRDSVFFTKQNASNTGEPSTLQYYEFTENLADEVIIEVFKNKDLSNFSNKNIFVGYGAVDPIDKSCKIFPPSATGSDNNITVCLPWWRIERQYLLDTTEGDQESSFRNFLSRMQRPRPPKNVEVCDSWNPSIELPGGTVSCTSYFDKTKNASCYANPKQGECYKNTCGGWVRENCVKTGRSIGIVETSRGMLFNQESDIDPTREITKVDLATEQYTCPGGSFTKYKGCADLETLQMYPYECEADNPNTPLDDSVMKYCDEDKPVRDASGSVVGFLGTCPDGKSIQCKVDGFTQTREECVKYEEDTIILKSEVIEESIDIGYTEQEVDVLSGALDRFASRDDCIRANTVEDSRLESVYANITGDGHLDDDIYVITHSTDDTHSVEYCNQQHNRNNGSSLNLPALGGVVSCIANNGFYQFEKKINIKTGDIISIQQATEMEDFGWYSFQKRTHYSSSKVIIDGEESTPEMYPKNFPYYPKNQIYIPLWESTLGSLTILFPYAGSYTLLFFREDGSLVVKKDLSEETFSGLNIVNYKQLFLAEDIPIAPTLNSSDLNSTETLCLKDDFTEYGGGVHGQKGSKTGLPCQSPSEGNTYQINNAIKRVIIKDNLTDLYTEVPLVYPLGYPNRVFISKLKVYEKRLYHCYENPSIKAPF